MKEEGLQGMWRSKNESGEEEHVRVSECHGFVTGNFVGIKVQTKCQGRVLTIFYVSIRKY